MACDGLERELSVCSLVDYDLETAASDLAKWSGAIRRACVTASTVGKASDPSYSSRPFTVCLSTAEKISRSCVGAMFSCLSRGNKQVQLHCIESHLHNIEARMMYHICGHAELSGSFVEYPDVIFEALRAALTEVLEPVADGGIEVNIPCEDKTDHTNLICMPQDRIEFPFEVVLADPNDKALAQEALRLEATYAGALKLLPALVDKLGSVTRLAVQLQVV